MLAIYELFHIWNPTLVCYLICELVTLTGYVKEMKNSFKIIISNIRMTNQIISYNYDNVGFFGNLSTAKMIQNDHKIHKPQ